MANVTPHRVYVSYAPSGPAAQGRICLYLDERTERRVAKMMQGKGSVDGPLPDALVDAITMLAIPQEIRDA